MGVRLTNAEGRAVYEVKPAARKFDMTLGGDAVQAFGFVTFPEKAAPGEYKLAVNVRDRTSGETTGFERKLTLKPAEFRIVALRFAHDAEGKVPAGTTLVAGDTLHYQFRAIGFDRSQKRVSLVMRVRVFDADGKDVGAKPVEARADVTDPTKAADARSATLGGQAALNRSGEFKLRITVEDTIAKKATTFETPLKVLPRVRAAPVRPGFPLPRRGPVVPAVPVLFKVAGVPGPRITLSCWTTPGRAGRAARRRPTRAHRPE